MDFVSSCPNLITAPRAGCRSPTVLYSCQLCGLDCPIVLESEDTKCQAGEMAQLERVLLCKCESVSSSPQNPHKRLAMASRAPATVIGTEIGRSWKLTGRLPQPEQWASVQQEVLLPCPSSCSGLCHSQRSMYLHTHMHLCDCIVSIHTFPMHSGSIMCLECIG